MKVLVTGANGFLGSALVARLLAHGETDLRCLIRPGRDGSKLREIAGRFEGAAVEIFEGDLTSRESARGAVADVAMVYHVAASMRGSAADLFQNTVVASKNILEALIDRNSVRVCLVSSFAVYGASGLPAGSIIDETTALEEHPERRDLYAFSKLRQENLFWEYRQKRKFPLVVVRPGVIYGPGGRPISTRVGIRVFGVFLHFGRSNLLPITYVDNCAEAIAIVGRRTHIEGEVYNIIDDDLPTSREFLRAYRRHVEPIRFVTVPYWVTVALSKLVERYHTHSRGQLAAILTPYKSAGLWKGNRFDNRKLKNAGWSQIVSTQEGLAKFFSYWRAHVDGITHE